MSIRTRLLLLVFAVWFPAVVGFGLLARSTYLREADAARERVQQLAQALNVLVEQELGKRAIMAKTLAASTAVRDGDLRRFHEEASAATRGTGNWAFLFTQTTQLTNTAIPFELMQPMPRRPNAPMENGEPNVYFSPLGEVVKKPVLAVFAPEANAAPPRFNVGIGFEPAVIQALIERQDYPYGSLVAVLDRNLRVMARSRDLAKWFATPATGELAQRARTGTAGFALSTTLDGIPSLSYLTAANRYDWTVVIAMPLATLSDSARRLTLQAFAAAGVLLLLGLGLALYASRRISAPVLALRHAAALLGQDKVPPQLSTGVLEADDVSAALHLSGLRSQEATRTLENRIAEAVEHAREAQAKLLDARKHEAIGRLTGGVAHDFNNLLQTISTGHHVLEKTMAEGPQRRVLHSAMRATSKAADLVRQMLAFGRAQPLEPQPVDLADFVLKCQELTSKAVGERIVLAAAIDANLPMLFVDPTQLELALLNLVFNARDAMPDGGKVTIAGRLASAQETAMLAPGTYVCLEISDDGPGMDAETLARAFEPYFTTKPVGAGSGLGLAQALAFARRSGGELRLASQVGVGTQARFYLPATELAPAAEQPRAASARAFRALDVLMVEDDVLVSSVVVSALESAGHRVRLCGSADDAAALLQEGRTFDVLFTDVVMPGRMTGLDLVEWCRVHRPGLPAVVASGYTPQQPDSAVPVLRKPYAMDALLGALQDACETHARRVD